MEGEGLAGIIRIYRFIGVMQDKISKGVLYEGCKKDYREIAVVEGKNLVDKLKQLEKEWVSRYNVYIPFCLFCICNPGTFKLG